MNKRIRELALEAGYRQDMFGIGHWDCQEFNNFVELMVKECADVVNYYHSRNEPVTPRQILQHFGVEETPTPVINVDMVKRLREETNRPMMYCKMALYACDGDHEQAKQWLLDSRNFRTKI